MRCSLFRISKLDIVLFSTLLINSMVAIASQKSTANYQADVIVYGGTPSAIISAVETAKSGKSVIVVSPDKHLGGMAASGLGYSDTGNKNTIGGLARDFYHRAFLHYQEDASWKWQKKSEFGNRGQVTSDTDTGSKAMDTESASMWIFEPHVAEGIFENYVNENKIRVLRNECLNRETGVVKQSGKILSIKTLSGKIFKAKVFIDATYEGDLMAAAKVSFHVGREANTQYNESYNGVHFGDTVHFNHFKQKVDPYKIPGNPKSGLLLGISSDKLQTNGTADHKIQAYCYRVCMSENPKNMTPFPKPESYHPERYELLLRLFAVAGTDWFNYYDRIPNRKTDTNNHGPFSSDYIGVNYEYPNASYAQRKAIVKDHENYQKGLLYFASHDPRVPQELRDRLQKIGLAKDEFVDNGNWPYQPYIREARRMVGEFVMTDNHVLGKLPVPQPVAFGSYWLDTHNSQRIVTSEGYVQNEGDQGHPVPKPYPISYKSLTPKKSECTNLLVPVCVSATHIAYGSIRMEPVFMMLGQAAGQAACLAIDQKSAVQDIDYNALKSRLQQKGAVLEFK